MLNASRAAARRAVLATLSLAGTVGLLTASVTQAAERCPEPERQASSSEFWPYSGARRRVYVRNQLDCPCQVIVRSFRSRRTYECPCPGKK